MTNPAETPEVQVDMAVNGVRHDAASLAELAQRWTHLVQEQLEDIEFARAILAGIVIAPRALAGDSKRVGRAC